MSSTRLFAERMGREASDSNMPVTTTCTLTSVVASKWMDSEHSSQIAEAMGARSAVQTVAEPIQVFVAHRMDVDDRRNPLTRLMESFIQLPKSVPKHALERAVNLCKRPSQVWPTKLVASSRLIKSCMMLRLGMTIIRCLSELLASSSGPSTIVTADRFCMDLSCKEF